MNQKTNLLSHTGTDHLTVCKVVVVTVVCVCPTVTLDSLCELNFDNQSNREDKLILKCKAISK